MRYGTVLYGFLWALRRPLFIRHTPARRRLRWGRPLFFFFDVHWTVTSTWAQQQQQHRRLVRVCCFPNLDKWWLTRQRESYSKVIRRLWGCIYLEQTTTTTTTAAAAARRRRRRRRTFFFTWANIHVGTTQREVVSECHCIKWNNPGFF